MRRRSATAVGPLGRRPSDHGFANGTEVFIGEPP